MSMDNVPTCLKSKVRFSSPSRKSRKMDEDGSKNFPIQSLRRIGKNRIAEKRYEGIDFSESVNVSRTNRPESLDEISEGNFWNQTRYLDDVRHQNPMQSEIRVERKENFDRLASGTHGRLQLEKFLAVGRISKFDNF
jgi:hypothetical protein